jgi:glutamine---fructose-6-phosphate transaminase (isomerizing)
VNGVLMAAEMAEQPEVLARLAARAGCDAASVRGVIPGALAGTVFLARGSSDNAAVFGRYLAELHGGRPAGLAAPSLYTRYEARVDWRGYLVVALSQSGATPEIVTTCAAMRSAGAVVIGITNEPGSPLAGSSDLLLCTEAGPELAVPATKTVTAQLTVLLSVTAALGGEVIPGAELGAGELPAAVAAVLADAAPVAELARRWAGIDRLVVAGRGLAYAAALETALKIKETTGILAEGFSVADLLHGPIAAVYAGCPVLLIDAGGPAASDTGRLSVLLSGRPADVTAMPLPAGSEPSAVVTAVVRGQQLAYALALARGMDPDAPAHLRKVTATS